MADPFGGMPPELFAEYQAQLRKQKLTDLLMQQSMQPMEAPVVKGRFQGAISPLQGAAKLLQAYNAGQMRQENDKAMTGLGEKYSKGESDAMAKYIAMRQGIPESDTGKMYSAGNNPDEQGGMGYQPAVAGNPRQAITEAMMSRYPQVQNIGSMDKKYDEAALARQDAAAKSSADIAQRAAEARTLAEQNAAARAAEGAAARSEGNLNRIAQIQAAAASRPAREPVIQPLVQIMGADGQPQWVERKDAVGKMPAGAGSKAEAMIAGKGEIDKDVMTLKTALDQLKEGGGITSTEKGTMANIGSWVANTGVGQTMGSMGGTNNQKARDVILQARPLLLRSIMQATGMSAKNLDSNAELKLWLATATDPTKGYEANIEALNNIAGKYGSGGFMGGQSAGGKITPMRRSSDTPVAGTVQGGYRFKGGNPAEQANWEKM